MKSVFPRSGLSILPKKVNSSAVSKCTLGWIRLCVKYVFHKANWQEGIFFFKILIFKKDAKYDFFSTVVYLFYFQVRFAFAKNLQNQAQSFPSCKESKICILHSSGILPAYNSRGLYFMELIQTFPNLQVKSVVMCRWLGPPLSFSTVKQEWELWNISFCIITFFKASFYARFYDF